VPFKGGQPTYRCPVVDLDALAQLVSERSEAWSTAGIQWTLREPSTTSKPSASVRCQTSVALGQLTVWVSGEVDVEVAYLARDGVDVVHYGLDEQDGLGSCLDELSRRLLAEPPLSA